MRRAAIGAGLACAVAAGGWVAGQSIGDDDKTTVDEPGVVHVHGLGVNPANDDLYVATHSGLFQLDGDEAERVGDGYQDTMGFTVVDRNRFLGSGHPEFGDQRLRVEGKPPLLGLIESNDGGKSWTSRSLLGEADFHALAYAGGRVYGWNASTSEFMVSEDMKTWTTRATVALRAFAVDPRDREHLIAAGETVPLRSTDGGATWAPVAGPPLVVVAWSSSGRAWGIDASGAVYSADDAMTWIDVGRIDGEPQALIAAGDDELVAAAHDGDGRTGIYQSADEGRTWQLRYRDPRQ